MSSRFYSSLTKKYVMSLAGLFLITFLLVHLTINLLILFDESRGLFNEAAHFMGTNPAIQTFQWVLFGGFIVHMIFGIILQIQNWLARPKGYKKKSASEENLLSKFMIHTGIIIGVFLVIHLTDFFFLKIQGLIPELVTEHGVTEDMGILVVEKFNMLGYVIFYVVALLFLGFHLDHAFQSALQSLGLTHPKYTPFFKGFSRFLAIVITLGYISIPLFIYFKF
jgi:succinate dehydrogenase / fumarate reductase, cytochrome b subunit